MLMPCIAVEFIWKLGTIPPLPAVEIATTLTQHFNRHWCHHPSAWQISQGLLVSLPFVVPSLPPSRPSQDSEAVTWQVEAPYCSSYGVRRGSCIAFVYLVSFSLPSLRHCPDLTTPALTTPNLAPIWQDVFPYKYPSMYFYIQPLYACCVELPLCAETAFPLYNFLPIFTINSQSIFFLITFSIQFKSFLPHFLCLFPSVVNLAATAALARCPCSWIIAVAFLFSSVVQVLHQMTNDCDSQAILHKRVCLSVIIGETVMLLGARHVCRGEKHHWSAFTPRLPTKLLWGHSLSE